MEIIVKNLQELEKAATSIAAELSANAGGFCCWLYGDMGAGKTTLTGMILHALGLDPKLPVTSPTFTYLNEYEIKGRWYAHLDLYRADEGFDLVNIGAVDSRDFFGVFLEWPEVVRQSAELLPLTHRLELNVLADGARKITLYKKT